jgi:cellulose synthase/poly-beta-1,6-N-acetylglucosamine synthase-like glycosyltransferase
VDAELLITAAAVLVTLTAGLLFASQAAAIVRDHLVAGRWLHSLEPVLFTLLVGTLVYGSLVYQLARLGYFHRLKLHRPASPADLDALLSPAAQPSLTVLVPAYKEDPRVVRKTLLSAALLDYPGRRVVLLIDNPPEPTGPRDADELRETRGLPGDVAALLAVPRTALRDIADSFEQRAATGFDAARETAALAAAHAEAGDWLLKQTDAYPVADHTDEFFVQLTFRDPARRHRERSEELLRGGALPTPEAIRAEYRRLVDRFAATLTSFERKRYVNLSHEPNKAMNLNSYLALMGGRFREEGSRQPRLVLAGADAVGGTSFPDSDYVLMLDADSVLEPSYAARLVQFLERPENRDVAVAQTPYSAFPGAERPLERTAGATTDIQYFIHQGFTRYGATFWVGANAIVRKRALEDIAESRIERGFAIRTFIHDRTVIEDTESSIDLASRGWRLHNHPERLAYSATPPDFGSLLIQRRRWANGGLLILPKLLRHVRGGRRLDRLGEAFFRFHYLVSLTTVNVGLLVLLATSFDTRLWTIWLPLSAAPYYALYGRDLCRAGYAWRDLPRVYALNLLLIPVNLGGVWQSIRQAWTGRRSAFGRTPKVEGRTAAPAAYLLAEYAMLAWWLVGAASEWHHARPLHALFALGNAVLLHHAVHTFIGHQHAWDDVRGWLTGVLRDRRPRLSAGLRSPSIALAALRGRLDVIAPAGPPRARG